MSEKAKYYVDVRFLQRWIVTGPTGDSYKRGAFKFARIFMASGWTNCRIRHRGRIIARWKDGKRVRQ